MTMQPDPVYIARCDALIPQADAAANRAANRLDPTRHSRKEITATYNRTFSACMDALKIKAGLLG